MRTFIVLLIVLAACASGNDTKKVPFPVASLAEDDWAVYEGRIISDKGQEMKIELSLMQAAVGVDSYFKMHKTFGSKNVLYAPSSQGKYSVSYGLPNHELGITINEPPVKTKTTLVANATLDERKFDVTQKQLKELDEMMDRLATPELYFRTDGNEKLIQTGRDFEAKDVRYVLYKRSNLFTVEGYVTFEDSVTEFFERNTLEKWKVAALADIDSVKIRYIELATEPEEGEYLKALAYSIADTTAKSNRSLVIKRALRIEKSSMQNPIK